MFTCSSVAIILSRAYTAGSCRVVAYGCIRTSTKFRPFRLTYKNSTGFYSPVWCSGKLCLIRRRCPLRIWTEVFTEHLVSSLSPFRQMSEYHRILLNTSQFTSHFGIRRRHNLNHDLYICRCSSALTNLRQWGQITMLNNAVSIRTVATT